MRLGSHSPPRVNHTRLLVSPASAMWPPLDSQARTLLTHTHVGSAHTYRRLSTPSHYSNRLDNEFTLTLTDCRAHHAHLTRYVNPHHTDPLLSTQSHHAHHARYVNPCPHTGRAPSHHAYRRAHVNLEAAMHTDPGLSTTAHTTHLVKPRPPREPPD